MEFITGEVNAFPVAERQPSTATRRWIWVLPGANETDIGDIGAASGQRDAIEATERRAILATAAAFGVGVARCAEEAARAAEAVGIAGLTAAAAASTDAGTLEAVPHTVALVVLPTKTIAARECGARFALLRTGARKTDVSDVGADTRTAESRAILTTAAALGVGAARGAEEAASATEAVGIARLTAAATPGADASAFAAI